jgi:hypothetical protein
MSRCRSLSVALLFVATRIAASAAPADVSGLVDIPGGLC